MTHLYFVADFLIFSILVGSVVILYQQFGHFKKLAQITFGNILATPKTNRLFINGQLRISQESH